MDIKISPLIKSDLTPYTQFLGVVVVRICNKINSNENIRLTGKLSSAYLEFGNKKIHLTLTYHFSFEREGGEFTYEQIVDGSILNKNDYPLISSFNKRHTSIVYSGPEKIEFNGLPEGILIIKSENGDEIILSRTGTDVCALLSILNKINVK